MTDIIKALEAVAFDCETIKEARRWARNAVASHRASVDAVELPEADITCEVDDLRLVCDWHISHLEEGHYDLFTSATVRRLIAEAVAMEEQGGRESV